MAKSEGKDQDQKDKVWRVAVLVVHGMGQQQRYQQLSELAAALGGEAGAATQGQRHYLHDGKLDKRVHLPGLEPPPGYKEVQLCLFELYWAYLIRGAVRLHEVLLWMGWAIYRELLPAQREARAAAAPRHIQPSLWRFLWLGCIILKLFVFCALVCIGTAWFTYESGHHLFQELHSISSGSQHLLDPFKGWMAFLLFSVSARALYVLARQPVAAESRRSSSMPDAGTKDGRDPAEQAKPIKVGRTPSIHKLVAVLSACVMLLTIALLWDEQIRVLGATLLSRTGGPDSLNLPVGLLLVALAVTVAGWLICSISVDGEVFNGRPPVWSLIWRPLLAVIVGLPLLVLLAQLLDPCTKTGVLSVVLLTLTGLAALIMLVVILLKSDWRAAATSVVALLLGAGALFYCLSPQHGGALGVSARPLACLSIMIFLYASIETLIANYFGDITVFITQDETRAASDLRMRILEAARAKLCYLLGLEQTPSGPRLRSTQDGGNFDRVAVVAHSLGNIVAYDALCGLYNQFESCEVSIKEELTTRWQERFAGLISCGCILEIVRYYFGRRASGDSRYDEINEHGKYGNGQGPFQSARWINIRSLMDPFTWPGLSSFGSIPEFRILSMWQPILCHMDYFRNPDSSCVMKRALWPMLGLPGDPQQEAQCPPPSPPEAVR